MIPIRYWGFDEWEETDKYRTLRIIDTVSCLEVCALAHNQWESFLEKLQSSFLALHVILPKRHRNVNNTNYLYYY